MIKNFLIILSLLSTPATSAAHDASCEHRLLSSFHLLVESAHKSGDLSTAQIEAILQSKKSINPFGPTGLQAHQAAIRKAIERLLAIMTEDEWTAAKSSLQQYFDKSAEAQNTSATAKEATRGVLLPRLLITIDRKNMYGFHWVSANPPTLALHVKKLRKNLGKIGINGIFSFDMIQPAKAKEIQALEKKIEGIVGPRRRAPYVTSPEGFTDIIDYYYADRGRISRLIRIEKDGTAGEYPIEVPLGQYETISSASIAHTTENEPIVAVTTDSKILIYRPISSGVPFKVFDQPLVGFQNAEQIGDLLKLEGEEPLLTINTRGGKTEILDPLRPAFKPMMIEAGIYPSSGAEFIKDSSGQVYGAIFLNEYQVAIFTMYDLGMQSGEVKK